MDIMDLNVNKHEMHWNFQIGQYGIRAKIRFSQDYILTKIGIEMANPTIQKWEMYYCCNNNTQFKRQIFNYQLLLSMVYGMSNNRQ